MCVSCAPFRHSRAYDGDIKTKYSPLSLSLSLHPVQPSIPSSLLGPAPSNSPQASRNSPPYSSVLNATTRGTFLPSLFSLSSQCRFAGWRGEVVERRKRERKLDEETAGGKKRKKDNRRSVGVEGRKAKEQPPRYRCTGPTATWKTIPATVQ